MSGGSVIPITTAVGTTTVRCWCGRTSIICKGVAVSSLYCPYCSASFKDR